MQRVYGTAFFSDKDLQAHLARIEEAKKRDHRKRRQGARALHVPPVGAGRRVLARQGHDALQHARQLHARRALPGRLPGSQDADHLQQGALGDLRPLGALSREHVPREVVRRRGDGAEGDELPRPLPHLRQRDPQLQGPAAALSRADAAAPQRSVGRAVGPDARPPVLAGRRALLRDGVADRRGSRAAAAAGAARLRRLRAAVLGQAVDAPGEVPRRGRDVGSRRGVAAGRRSTRRASPTRSTPATARSTARSSTSTSPTRSAASGSARTIQLDYQMPRALRPEIRRAPTTPSTARWSSTARSSAASSGSSPS